MEEQILIEHVNFEYSPGRPVLHDVSLTVPRGAYVALLGANGSGKSTLARQINGILIPTSGRVLVEGMDTREESRRMDIRRLVGMVFQHPDNQIVATTVEDDVAFGPENFNLPPEEIRQRVTSALEETGLLEQRTRPPHLLSGGQKQRLAIAGALAMEQPILVLDEATSMLDAMGREDVLSLVRALHQKGTTILTVTHHMEEVLEADSVVVLDHGRVVMKGTPREIFRQNRRLRELNLDVPLMAQIAGALHEEIPEVPAEALEPEAIASSLRGHFPSEARGSLHRDKPDTSPAMPLIRVEGLAHRYLAGTPLAHQGLKHADLGVAPGEALAIVGATGSGKSTVMQHLNGIFRPQTGSVVAMGVDLRDPKADIARVRREVGMLFQNPEEQLFEQLVGDDVAYGPLQAKLDLREVRQRVRYGLEMVGLDFEEFKDRPIYALSGGEKRRVALAGILALRPRVLVLDEPTAGLDPVSAEDLLRRLRHLKTDGVSVVFVTHNLEEVLNLADRVVIMRDAQTKGTYPVEVLVEDPEIIASHGLEIPDILRFQVLLRAQGHPVFGRGAEEVVESILGLAKENSAS